MSKIIKAHEFATSQEAWEGLNEYFLLNQKEITKRGGGRYGPQMVSYDHYVHIRKAWVDPSFDFGNVFGYRKQKWTGLINNYINRDLLDIVKSQIVTKELKKSPNYNISMTFDNSHNNGKNCLLSMTFSKRVSMDHPVISFNLRSSEITKRLLLDLLLVQRIAEFIYGEDEHISINMSVVNMYQNAESFTMYDLVKPIHTLVKDKNNVWQKRVLDTLELFKTCDLKDIKYKVHQRSVKQLQRPNGIPLSGDKPMLAKNLKF